MGRSDLRERIGRGVFLLDGATGTELIAHGVEIGKCNDYLNIERAELIFDVQRAYIEAGSDAILSNTFGANKYALGRHGLSEMVRQLNAAGTEIARRAAGEDNYVLGDMGPTGDFLEPLGMLKADELKEAFSAQAEALAEGGVDGFIIETMTAVDEAKIAVEGIKAVSELPVLVSFAFDKAGEDFKTMMGVGVESFVSEIGSLGVDALGFNCGGLGLDDYVELAAVFVRQVGALGRPTAIMAEPNAGRPELVDGQTVYKVGPEDFAAAVEKIHRLGVNILGGCCGTSPAHIAALAERVK